MPILHFMPVLGGILLFLITSFITVLSYDRGTMYRMNRREARSFKLWFTFMCFVAFTINATYIGLAYAYLS